MDNGYSRNSIDLVGIVITCNSVRIDYKISGLNFLDLPKHLTNFEDAEVVILCAPYEASTSYGKGAKFGPAAILDASAQVELYDEELDLEPCQVGISTRMPFEEFNPEPEKAIKQIAGACEELLNKNKFIVGVGGEHTVSVGFVQAFKNFYPDMWVLQLDAHSDLRESYQDSPLNHACVMARINELCPFIGTGIRSSIRGERELLQTPSELYYAWEMHRNSSWADSVLEKLGDPVYITIDLDFFDPSVVPSVGTPEPGGFQWFESLDFLKRIIHSRRIIGFDVVELSPKAEFITSDFFAAKLIYKLIGYIFEDKIKKFNKK